MGGTTPDAPHASEPAADSAAPAPAPPPAAPAAPPAVTVRYVGGVPRRYYFPGAPISVKTGDVIELPPGVPYNPHDADWQLAPGAAVTRLPDNHPDNPNQPQAPDPDLIAHSMEERDQILRGLGLIHDEEA